MAVIDSHVHYYLDEVIEDPGGWADRNREQYWRRLMVGEKERGSIQGWASLEKMIRDMDEGGVDRVVMQGWYWENGEVCEMQNGWYLECYRRYPERIIPFMGVQPRAGGKVFEGLEYGYEHGMKGIGEVFPEAQGFSMEDPVWLKVVEWAIERGMPITMHVTEPVGHDYLGKVESPLGEYLWLARRYPELKLILSHWGGLLPFYEYNPIVKEVFRNVYYDTSASPLLYDNRIYRAVIEAVGVEKILFGSDYPLRVFPRRQKEADFVSVMGEVREAGLSQEEYGMVMGGNFARLVGL